MRSNPKEGSRRASCQVGVKWESQTNSGIQGIRKARVGREEMAKGSPTIQSPLHCWCCAHSSNSSGIEAARPSPCPHISRTRHLDERTSWTGASSCPHPSIVPLHCENTVCYSSNLPSWEQREGGTPLERKETAQIVSLNFEQKE